jgi:hypothetical protein
MRVADTYLYISSFWQPLMSFFRSYIAPFFIVLIFVIAMIAVSARIVLPTDMMAPAPVVDPDYSASPTSTAPVDSPAPALSELLHGPDEFGAEG